MRPEEFRILALWFPGTTEHPHFDRTAFKARRIFATLHEASLTANIMLSPKDQQLFCVSRKRGIFPVPNKWGQGGATTFELDKVPKETILSALESAYKRARTRM